MYKKLTQKNNLGKKVISKNVFEREIALCKKLNKGDDGKGCSWGKCNNCGAIPLLIKLHKGALIEDKKELKKIRKEIFN